MESPNAKIIFDAGTALAAPRTAVDDRGDESTPFVVVPDGYKVKSLEEFLPAPAATRAQATLHDEDSFCRYWARFAHNGSALFADPKNHKMCAVFDYHTKDRPSWCKHTAVLACVHSPEWQAWRSKDGQAMSQTAFAEFIETNLSDIIKPDSAKVLEASRSLQAKKNIRFVSAVRLEDGERQFSYEEEIKGTTAKGAVRFPEELHLGIPVFQGGARYAVLARLRYRINDDGLVLWYALHRPSHIVDDAFAIARKAIEKRLSVEALSGAYAPVA